MVPAVALNVAVVAAAATLTEAGTVNSALLLDKETEMPPAGATLESVTVQVEAAAVPKVEGAHASELTSTGAVRDTVAVFEVEFSVAVTTAD